MKKRLISLLIAPILLGCISTPAFASNTNATLYDMYSDNMLFEQNAISKISGTATSGSKIEIEIYNSKNEKILSSSAEAKNNNFSVEFLAPKGSFESYSIIVKENGKEFKTLKNIVFGELWIASGQSNMQYPLAQASGGKEDAENHKKQSQYIRVMTMPIYDKSIDSKSYYDTLPYEEQNDVKGSLWITGESEAIYGVSAVAFYFANKLSEDLNIPVGFINAPLGGTPIATWIPRDAIEDSEDFKNTLINHGQYISKNDWISKSGNIYQDLTANYNIRIAPLKNFAVSGLVWYQGESDVMLNYSPEEYSLAFNLLQDSYSKLFNFENKKMPIVFTQLAPYSYSDNGFCLPQMNVAFADIQKQDPSSRALVASYDLTPTYIPEAGAIHPEPKKEIGERMAFVSQSLVYNKNNLSTIAYVKSVEIKNSDIFVTLDNVGDGLASDQEILKGFSICGNDGIYLNANAEIISKDTIKIWNENIRTPKSATYAYSATTNNARIYSTNNNEKLLPISPFITDKSYCEKLWKENHWIDCDNDTVWHNATGLTAGYYDTWEASNCTVTFSRENCYKDGNGINVKANASDFSINPLMKAELDGNNTNFYDVETDYSKYVELNFYIRNNGKKPVTLTGVNFYKNSKAYFTPVVLGTSSNDFIVPADNEWHKVTLDLSRVNLNGNEDGLLYANDKLSEIENIKLCFESEGPDSNISIDNFSFATAESTENFNLNSNMTATLTILQSILNTIVLIVRAIFN